MTNCPVCNNPVDPLRSRWVAVRAGKVVGYCSPECRAAAETQPTKVPAAGTTSGVYTSAAKTEPAPAAPEPKAAPKLSLEDYDSGPVIEILHEPASGVVTSARDPREEPAEPAVTEKPTDKPADKRAPAGKKADKAGAKAQAKAEKRALKSDRVAALDKATKPKTSDDAATASGERESAPKTPTATATDTTDPKTVLSGVEAEAPAAPRSARQRRDSIDSKAAWDWLDDEPAEPVGRRSRRKPEGEGRSKAGGLFLALFVIVLVGAGGYLVYRYLIGKPDAAARVQPEAVPRVEVVEQVPVDAPAPPVAKELEHAVGTAMALLRNYLQSTSPRVQRTAADALARANDPEAIEVLAKLLQTERIGKSVIAYILARSGDSRGTDFLVAAMKTGERSDKLDAAARLAWLGDKRAADRLASFLTVTQVKFEAAKNLAILRDPRGIAFFEDIRANPKASPEDKARAAIALGLAGKPEVAEELRGMLADNRMNHDAAAALVALKDLAARPVLVDHLQNVSMQTEAAQLLRTLEPDLDAWPIVKPLVARLAPADLEGKQDATKTTKDVNQISLAETILLLAGPAHWADKK